MSESRSSQALETLLKSSFFVTTPSRGHWLRLRTDTKTVVSHPAPFLAEAKDHGGARRGSWRPSLVRRHPNERLSGPSGQHRASARVLGLVLYEVVELLPTRKKSGYDTAEKCQVQDPWTVLAWLSAGSATSQHRGYAYIIARTLEPLPFFLLPLAGPFPAKWKPGPSRKFRSLNGAA